MTSPASDVSPPPQPANFTRRTRDLVAKFRRNRQWHLIPLYHLMRLSDFGREGIEHSGSYLFADHMYRNVASGRGVLGCVMDRVLLNLPATQAMRRRYLHTRDILSHLLKLRSDPLRVLALPCGLPRDVLEVLEQDPALSSRLIYTGIDIDPKVVQAAETFLADTPMLSKRFAVGDALNGDTFSGGSYDLIISTGLGEFLTHDQLTEFYAHVYESLSPGGIFCTSTTAWDPRSDYLLRAFELQTNYRSTEETRTLLERNPWRSLTLRQDVTGLQTFVTAVKS